MKKIFNYSDKIKNDTREVDLTITIPPIIAIPVVLGIITYFIFK